MAKKILLVDDDLYIRDLYAEMLKDENYEVLLATNGEEGLSMLSESRVDLVLLDVMMPNLDGIQTLTQIKQNPKLKEIPVIMLTNFGQEDLVKQAINLGSADYLLKYNLTPGEITQKIAHILNPKEVQL